MFFLALRSANPGGRFYINGEMNLGHLDPSQRYQIAGTYVTYTRPYQSEKGETIVANGPITEALEVLVRRLAIEKEAACYCKLLAWLGGASANLSSFL